MKNYFATQSSVFWLMRSKAGCYKTCNETNSWAFFGGLAALWQKRQTLQQRHSYLVGE
jgi:hypothetical protein